MYIKIIPNTIIDESLDDSNIVADRVILGSTIPPTEDGWVEYNGPIPVATSHEWDAETKTVVPSRRYQQEIRKSKLKELKTSYEQANQEDIAYMSTTFQADKDSQSLLVSVLSAGAVPEGFYWLDADNNKVPMTYEELQGLSGSILTRAQGNFTKYQELKAQVKLATTQDELDLIKWEGA